jgi:glycosyl hydrolase family 123
VNLCGQKKHLGALVVCFVVTLAWLFGCSHANPSPIAGPYSIWTASAMERVGKNAAPAQRSSAALSAARRQYTAFQVIVSAGAHAITRVDLVASDLYSPQGSVISSSNLSFYREHYVNVRYSSPDFGQGNRPLGPGWYADALVPFIDPDTGLRPTGGIPAVPFDVAPYSNQPVWVDVYVPQNAAPGFYSGTVRIFGDQLDNTIPISLHVRNFTLPLEPTLKSSFGMHEPQLSDRAIHELLLRHRIMPASVNPTDAADLRRHLGLNVTGLRFWGHSDRRKCMMDQPPEPSQILAERRKYPPGLLLYMYPADEIDPCSNLFNTVRQWAAVTRSADPQIKNLVTVSPVPALYAGDASGRSAVDIWTLLPKNYDAAGSRVAMVKAKGDEIWSYTALVQEDYSPKWEIDFAPVNYRIQAGFLSQSLGLTGLLYWRVDLWTEHPWQDVQTYAIEGHQYAGEGMLIYPGRDAGVSSAVPSMRLKWIREGVDDYEYVAILKRLGRGEWALEHIRSAAKDWSSWTQDATVVESVRKELADEIERLTCCAE